MTEWRIVAGEDADGTAVCGDRCAPDGFARGGSTVFGDFERFYLVLLLLLLMNSFIISPPFSSISAVLCRVATVRFGEAVRQPSRRPSLEQHCHSFKPPSSSSILVSSEETV